MTARGNASALIYWVSLGRGSRGIFLAREFRAERSIRPSREGGRRIRGTAVAFLRVAFLSSTFGPSERTRSNAQSRNRVSGSLAWIAPPSPVPSTERKSTTRRIRLDRRTFPPGHPVEARGRTRARDEEEDCRRSRSTRERHSGPGWSPVNLLLIPLSAQISSEDVLGPTSPRFLLSFDGECNRPFYPGSLLCFGIRRKTTSDKD